MASISLRAYNKEIEGLIETEQVKDAIAHSRHILRQFPKHIETYRLLGRAYLESQRYTEAADVLQRVLSSLPDDFVSQIGMSMIREDEGNLDAAIFHMERAFEAQPSNSAVQEELKRLYGRRDGVVPPKIRLTRGALVRMYARGDLFQQAIAEAKVALSENPERVELEVILARMFFNSGQKVSATEVASKLIEKLPFCVEANRILAEVLPGTARAEDAKVYKQRLVALDPYLAHVPSGSSSSADVPDDAVTLDIFDTEAEEEATAQPDWAQSVGVKLEESAEETLPDWLMTPEAGKFEPEVPAAVEEEEAAEEIEVAPAPEFEVPVSEPVVEEAPQVEEALQVEEIPEAEEELPDWMQSAGWQPATGDVTEEPVIEDLFEEAAAEMPADEAEIPDWLQAIAPTDEAVEQGLVRAAPDSEEDNAWLESILSEAEQKAGTLGDLELAPEDDGSLLEAMGIGEGLPPAIGEDFLDEIDAAATTPDDTGEIPEWLTGLAEIDEPVEEPVASTEDEDWLEILSSKEGVIPETETGITEEDQETFAPAEDFGVESEIEYEETAAPETPAVPFAASWDEEVQPEEAAPFAAELAADAENTTGDFLAEFEAAAPVDPDATQPTRVRRPEAEPPVEVPAFQEIETEETLPEESETFIEQAEFGAEIEPLVEKTESTQRATEPPKVPAPILMDEEDLSIFDLVEPEEKQPVRSSMEEEELAETEPEDIYVPDWLKESLEKETVAETPEVTDEELEEGLPEAQQSAEEITGEPELVEDVTSEDDDAAFSWLEALAARQGADEETLQVAPEERLEETPDWIKSEIEQAGSDVEQVSAAEELEPEIDLSGEAVQEVEAETAVEAQPEPIPSYETPEVEIEPPAWSQEQEGIPAGQTEPEMTEAAPSAEDQELPEWFKETLEAEDETIEEELEAAPQPVIYRAAGEWQPEELIEPEVEVPAEISAEVEAEPEIEPETSHEFAAGTVKETEPVSSEVAEPVREVTSSEDTEPEEVPEWLQGLAEEQAGVVPVAAADAEKPPEWLKDLEDEESGLMPAVPYSASTGQTGWLKKAEESAGASKVEDTSPVRVTPTPSVAQPVSTGEDDLYNAQAALNEQDIDNALDYYNRLISRGEALEDTIHDLRDAVYRYPVDVNIWQSLGDAYMRSNQLQEALDAYTKAEELLR